MSEPDARKRCVRMEAGVWCMVIRQSATVHLNSLDLSARSHRLVTTEFIQLNPFLFQIRPTSSNINIFS